MLVGQNLGPFHIVKELGSGAMGTVYLATYEKTNQPMAIKIMAPGLVANEAAVARFEREANILKQLRHPNIVRLLGVGKTAGLRYYAMEYVEGESLDRTVLRRGGKLGWEEVVGLGIQLCAALQHAHEKGVVHRDLKPSNLMLLKDGTLKLTDFGIAKDLDVTALTGANCTVGTAAYMSPEQCRGDRDLTFKSDLYSLGVVFYELLTGQKPFQAENAMDMFLCHVGAMPERPSRKEMTIPIFLDTLILQLMEKKPEDRPRDANAVAESLERIKEKVEASQSAGEDSLKARRIDRLSENRRDKLSAEDREAARALKGKGKKKKKGGGQPFYQKGWFVGLAITAVLAAFLFTLYLIFRPASPETLYAQAETLMKSENPDDWQRAADGPIKEYLTQYAGRTGKETDQIRTWDRAVDVYNSELLLQNYLRRKKRGHELNAQNDAETAAFKATDLEEKGDLAGAETAWTDIKKEYGSGSGYVRWSYLAEGRLAQLVAARNLERAWIPIFDNLNRFGREPENLSEEEVATLIALRLFLFGDSFRARKRFEELHEKLEEVVARKPALRKFRLFAAMKAYDLRDAQDIDRKKMLTEKLLELQDRFDRGICQSIITLYGGDPDLQVQVEQARALMKARTQ